MSRLLLLFGCTMPILVLLHTVLSFVLFICTQSLVTGFLIRPSLYYHPHSIANQHVYYSKRWHIPFGTTTTATGTKYFYSNVPITTTTTTTEMETKNSLSPTETSKETAPITNSTSSSSTADVVRLPLRIPFNETTRTLLEQALNDMVQSTLYMEQIPPSSQHDVWQWTCYVPAFQQYVHLQYVNVDNANQNVDQNMHTAISDTNSNKSRRNIGTSSSTENVFPYGYLALSLQQRSPMSHATYLSYETKDYRNDRNQKDDDTVTFGWICLKFYEMYTTTHFVHIFDDTYELQPRVLLQHSNIPAIYTAWNTNITTSTSDRHSALSMSMPPTSIFMQHLFDQYTNIVPDEYQQPLLDENANETGHCIENDDRATMLPKIANIFRTLDTRGYIMIDPVTHTNHGLTTHRHHDDNPDPNIALLTTWQQREALSKYFFQATVDDDHRYSNTIRTDQIHFVSSKEQAMSCHIVEQYNLLMGLPHFMNEVEEYQYRQRHYHTNNNNNKNDKSTLPQHQRQVLSVPRSIQFAEYGYGDFYIAHSDNALTQEYTNDGVAIRSNFRAYTCILYLNDDDWNIETDGGALRLYPNSQNEFDPIDVATCGRFDFVDIAPINGRLLIFDSRLVHSVEKVTSVHRRRRALTLWINRLNDSGVRGEMYQNKM